jgi:hypothetical protein
MRWLPRPSDRTGGPFCGPEHLGPTSFLRDHDERSCSHYLLAFPIELCSKVVTLLDAVKFAFEILIVGALALPWIAIVGRMLIATSPAAKPSSYLSALPRASEHGCNSDCAGFRIRCWIGSFTGFP